jgi:hypothetical protein
MLILLTLINLIKHLRLNLPTQQEADFDSRKLRKISGQAGQHRMGSIIQQELG